MRPREELTPREAPLRSMARKADHGITFYSDCYTVRLRGVQKRQQRAALTSGQAIPVFEASPHSTCGPSLQAREVPNPSYNVPSRDHRVCSLDDRVSPSSLITRGISAEPSPTIRKI